MSEPKRMHCQERLLGDLKVLVGNKNPLDEIIGMWSNGKMYRYSTSAHLPVLWALCRGLNARKIGEIGFGRSSFVLAYTAQHMGASVICCDRYDYSYMLRLCDPEGKLPVRFIVGDADAFYADPEVRLGMDFLFLDYMSTRDMTEDMCYHDLKRAIGLVPINGIVAVHDALSSKYNVAGAMNRLSDKYKRGVEMVTLPYGYGLGIIRNRMKSPFGIIEDGWHKSEDSHE